jgi:hypothetical protein
MTHGASLMISGVALAQIRFVYKQMQNTSRRSENLALDSAGTDIYKTVRKHDG